MKKGKKTNYEKTAKEQESHRKNKEGKDQMKKKLRNRQNE